MTPPADVSAVACAVACAAAGFDPITAMINRLTEPVRMCVLEVGQARGRRDADDLLATVPADKIAALCADVIDPGYDTGELAAALHRLGALAMAHFFPANAGGYFHLFCRHTIAMMLTDDERDLLARRDADEGTLAGHLHDMCAWALMHGWEVAVAAALKASTNTAAAGVAAGIGTRTAVRA